MAEGSIVRRASAPGPALARAVQLLDRRDTAGAERELAVILDAHPEDAQALQMLGLIRAAQARLDEAESLYRRSLASDPVQPAVFHNVGNLLRRVGRTQEAISALKQATALKANYAEAHLSLALAYADLGDHAGAEKSARDALRYQPNYLLAQQTLAVELCALQRPQEAERLLRRALAAGIRDPRQAAAIEHTLAMALKQQERFSEALKLFDAAQSKVPDLPAVDFNRATTLQQLGHVDESVQWYRRAAARDPGHADAHAGLALMSALTGDFALARQAGSEALTRGAHNPNALIALAIADIEDGAFAQAGEKLERVTSHASFAADAQTAFALGFAADAFERKARTQEAFALYRRSNAVRNSVLAAFDKVRARHDVERLTSYFAKAPKWTTTESLPRAPLSAASHVFILGFMRSGPTLLETILSTNPDVEDIDEIEFLTAASREFLLDETGLARLAGLGADEAARWRAAYWKSVTDAGLSVSGKIFVDKMPFNSLRLPLIARLFPDAKVIFAIRDPRDVVISCFRRRFSPTAFSYEFLDLGDCARFYAQSMALVDLYRAKLPLAIHEHSYEGMIADFDATLRATCDFIGMPFDPAMREFSAAAQGVDRRSASAAQVRRGLYADGVGQWKQYRDEIAPVLPQLAPALARWHYAS